MPPRLPAAQRAARGIISPSTSYLWISDELLQESFNAFTSRTRAPACKRHNSTTSTPIETTRRSTKLSVAQSVSSGPTCKRYGSSVPGPLEARRRLSKRRLGCLATGQYGSPPIDPALLFKWFGDRRGTSQQQPDFNWLPPGYVEQKKAGKHQYPNLPAWLDVKHPNSDVKYEASERILEPPPRLDPVTIEEYKARLNGVKTLADIRALNKELEYATLNEKQCSKAAFEHLMSAYKLVLHTRKKIDHPEVVAARQTLLGFVDDSKLECSGGYNLMKLLTIMRKKEVPWQEFVVLSRNAQEVLSYSVEMLDRNLRTQIAIDVLKIGAQAFGEQGQEQLLALCDKIWRLHNGMKIPHAVAEHIFLCISRMEVSPASMHLAIEVIRVCRPSAPQMLLSEKETKDMHASKSVSFDWVEAIGNFVRSVSTKTRSTNGRVLMANDELGVLYLLKNLPKETVTLFAGMVTHSFVNDLVESRNSDMPLRILCAWVEALDVVHELHWTTGLTGDRLDEMVKALASVVWPSDVPFVFDKLHGSSMCYLLREHWVPRLEKMQPHVPLSSEDSTETVEVPSTTYSTNKHLDLRSHEKIAAARFDFHLEKCAARLETLSGEWYNPRQITLLSLIHATYLSDIDWPRLLLEILTLLKLQNRHNDFDCLVRGWKRLTRVNLFTAAHRKVISDYINSRRAPEAHMEMRLLQQDENLHLSDHPHLMTNCIASDSVRALDIIRLLLRNDPQAILPQSQLDSACILTSARIDLIHNTALAIATSARFSCRESCSSVYFLWQLLRYHCAPVDDRLAQAVIISNLLKPIVADEWIPEEQLNWAFGVLGDIHGEEAVKELNEKIWAMREKKPYQMLPYGLEGVEGEARWERDGRREVDWSLLPALDQHADAFVGPKWMSVKARRFENMKLENEGWKPSDTAADGDVVRRVEGQGLTPSLYAAKHYWGTKMPERPTAVDWWKIARENSPEGRETRSGRRDG